MKNTAKFDMIVATDLNWNIGYTDGKLLVKLKDDMNHFKWNTMNGVVIMGNNTLKSLPKRYLPNRLNIVLTKDVSLADTWFKIYSPNQNREYRMANEARYITVIDHYTPIIYVNDISKVKDVIEEFRVSNPTYNFNYNRQIIIGGGQIYKTALDNDLIDEIIMTTIHRSCVPREREQDAVKIPNIFEYGFKKITDNPIQNENGYDYSINIYKK